MHLNELAITLQVSGITAGRAAALFPGILGLIGILVGWLALSRFTRRNNRIRGALTSLIVSAMGIILSASHLIRTAGSDFGTGSGRLGAIVAFVVGVIGIIVGGLAFSRARRSTPN